MIYIYKCKNEACAKHNKEVEVDKPMCDCSKKEQCEFCEKELQRVYKTFAANTNDGFKL